MDQTDTEIRRYNENSRKRTRKKGSKMDTKDSAIAIVTENGLHVLDINEKRSPKVLTSPNFQDFPDTDTETIVDEMERLNKTLGKNDTFTLSPPQDVPVRDTGLDYTPQRKTVREKSRSCHERARDRLRFEKRHSLPTVPVLDLDQISSRSERQHTAYLNENQNSAFATFSNENQNHVLPGSINVEQINSSVASSREKHSTCVANCLFDMWQSQRMCDVVLKIGGHDFPAHRLAIAAHSQGFSSKFCKAKNTSDVCYISVPNCSLDAAQQILKYIYTSEINLTMQNIDSILACAKHLGITDILEEAKHLLINHTADNALEVMKIARKHELLDIFSNVYDNVCYNFKKVVETESFLKSTPKDLCRLLSDDNLNVEQELDVFFAAMKWLDFNREDRFQYARDIFGTVRFVHICPEDMVNYVEPNIVLTDDCKNILMDVFRFHALKYSGSQMALSPDREQPPERQYHPRATRNISQTSEKSPERRYCNSAMEAAKTGIRNSNILRPTPLVGLPTHSGCTPLPTRPPLMVATGGVDPFSSLDGDAPARLVAEYNPYSNTWGVLTRLPDARHHHGSAVLDDHIYVVGGSLVNSTDLSDLANPTNACYRYDAQGNFWTRIAPMKHKRMYHAVAVLCGVLYAIGGQNELGESLRYVEYYNPDTDRWGEVCPMSEAKIGASAAGHRGLVYVVGGFVETDEEKVVLGTVECYDPRKNRWLCKNPLPGPRCHAGMVEIKGTLYLVGGSTFYDDSDAITSLDAILRLDDDHDRWDVIQTLRVPRHDAGVSSIGNNIYIVGGVTSSDNHALSDVEVLDVVTCEWQEGVDWLSHAALGISCCTLETTHKT